MPSHQHQHHQCCCCCSCCCCSSSSPTPSLTSSDQLLQALAAHLLLLQSPTPPPSPPPLLYSHRYLKSQQTHHLPPPIDHPKDREQPHHHHQNQTQSLLHSLLNRVSALESSRPHLSSSPRSCPSPQQPTARPCSSPPAPRSPSLSLRDLAARTIQTHFRRLLVRRSQALRHLKRLAAIKSHVAALRSSLSDKTHLDHPEALSEKAMDLLLELDSIQSRDPTIREGRRSISRELVRILEFIDKILVREHQEPLEAIEIAANGRNRRASEKIDSSKGVEGIEGCPPGVLENGAVALQSTKPMKRVSFLENGKRASTSVFAHESCLEEFSDSSNRRGPAGRLGREVGGTGAREHLEAEGSHQFSDDEKSSEGSAEAGSRYGEGRKYQGPNGTSGFSAPLPVQMEPRISDSKKRMVSPRS